MKDFYDLWFISRSFAFDHVTLSGAIQRTFERRETPLPQALPTGLTEDYASQWNPRWRTFLKRELMQAAPDNLAAVIADLSGFLMPLLDTPVAAANWPPGGPWGQP